MTNTHFIFFSPLSHSRIREWLFFVLNCIAAENKALHAYCGKEGITYRQDRTQIYGYADPKRKKKAVDFVENVDISGGSGIIFTKKQLGKKFGKHCADWGLNPQSSGDRDKMKDITCDIKEHCEEVRIGAFNGQNEECLFYIKGEDVVITKLNNEFVTILKGGRKDGWVENARKS